MPEDVSSPDDNLDCRSLGWLQSILLDKRLLFLVTRCLPAVPNHNDPFGITSLGRKISQIPCFRKSFLYGISGFVGVGLIAFLFTSRPMMSSHIAFAGFNLITVGYWCVCRSEYDKQLKIVKTIHEAIHGRADEIALNSTAGVQDLVTVSNENTSDK